MRLLMIIVCLCGLSACHQQALPSSSDGKIEGLPVKGLSHEELAAALKECTKYGRIDEPRVRYTAGYCSAVMSAHLTEGYAASARPAVDPNVNRLH